MTVVSLVVLKTADVLNFAGERDVANTDQTKMVFLLVCGDENQRLEQCLRYVFIMMRLNFR